MPEWIDTGVDWFVKGVVPLFVVVVLALFNRKLEAFKRDNQEKLEALKQSLQDILARKRRRADYLRDQIQNLYGPLAFLLESNDRQLGAATKILEVFMDEEVSENRTREERLEDQTTETRRGYHSHVIKNNEAAAELLRTGWGWLDADDVDLALEYITDIARLRTEFENFKYKLERSLYRKGKLEDLRFSRPEFIERIRERLVRKQKELSGLTTEHE